MMQIDTELDENLLSENVTCEAEHIRLQGWLGMPPKLTPMPTPCSHAVTQRYIWERAGVDKLGVRSVRKGRNRFQLSGRLDSLGLSVALDKDA